ncbi:nucleotide-binding domain-containing protein [Bacillus infantis]|uniref:nucleotide-binding domain-containing protein n=1 Tax=Bacillus infantis TaxID=324767 RepID=UPI0020A1953B|nr:nucleotidyltransferase [Bacillus infantis]MCP1156992.1 nucleotidyltransferase [Bacillus infantis]
MSIGDAFEEFIEYLQDIKLEDKEKRMKRITKKLNKVYYDGNESEEEHFLLVGSLGRHTAINGVSDVDIAFVFPEEIYNKYNNRKHNGQKDLLQDVKETLSELAPRTIVRGDGQVVVLEFSDYEVELCPYFVNDDDSYLYPNSNNGGSWKTTKPIPEIAEAEIMIDETNGHYQNVCNLVRAWKNNYGFKFGGLLIDTLVRKFFISNSQYYETQFSEYPQLLKDLFIYLKGLDKDQEYWLALGSNQRVYNKDGKFVSKAKKAYNKIKDIDNDDDEMFTKMREIFGTKFPKLAEETVEKSLFSRFSSRNTEEFIEEKYPVDIKVPIEINCYVSQDGWRDKTPLRHLPFLRSNKSLRFSIDPLELDSPYEVLWKVRNVGEIAHQKDLIRGQIVEGNFNMHIHEEKTQFKGEHYVEVYVIKNGVVIAKDRIDVPISITKTLSNSH